MPAFNAIGLNAVGTTANSSSGAALSCIATASSSVTANLTTAIRLSSTITATSAVSATLSTGATLSASIAASSSVSANLTTQIKLQATLQAVSEVSGDLTVATVIPTFTPSAARTIFVQSASPVFTGSKWWNLADSKKPRGLKDPDATIDITFDWSDWLNDISPAIISDVTFTVVGSDNVNTFHDGTTATVFLSGGVVGAASTVACKIQTNTTPARTDERTVYIDIADE